MIVMIAMMIGVVSSSRNTFKCMDKSNRCREWRANVARSLGRRDTSNVCRDAGNDYEFLLLNCPKHCNLCKESEERWKRDQENMKIEQEMMKKDFKDGIEDSPECDALKGSTWKLSSQEKSTYTFREDGTFVPSSDATCKNSRCKWSCHLKTNGKLKLQVKYHSKGLHDATLESSSSTMKLRRVFNRRTLPLELLNRDLYRVLGLSKDVEQSEIRKRYRKLSRNSHPDRLTNPTEKDRTRFDEITAANDVLSDPDRRRIYDSMGASEFHSRDAYERAISRGSVKKLLGGFYKNSDVVKTITSKNFVQEVYQKDMTLIEFYAPWCYHCQKMVGRFKQTAILLESENVKTGAVDCDANMDVCQQLRVTNYPTIRFFPGYRKANGMGIDYNGEHEPEMIRGFVDSIVNNRVEELTESQFRQKVLGSNDDSVVWLIDYSANAWCGPCTGLKQPLRNMAQELESTFETARSLRSSWDDDGDDDESTRMRVRVGIVNCDVSKDLCKEQSVSFYPQLRLYSKASRMKSGSDLGDTLEINDRGGAWAVLELFSITMRHIAMAESSAALKRDEVRSRNEKKSRGGEEGEL